MKTFPLFFNDLNTTTKISHDMEEEGPNLWFTKHTTKKVNEICTKFVSVTMSYCTTLKTVNTRNN